MEPTHLLAYETVRRSRDRLRSALPDAPVVPDRTRAIRLPRVRLAAAAFLRGAADRLEPRSCVQA